MSCGIPGGWIGDHSGMGTSAAATKAARPTPIRRVVTVFIVYEFRLDVDDIS